MTVVVLAVLCLALLAYCVWRDRQAKATADMWKTHCDDIVRVGETERHALLVAGREERETLLQRIQAPERAIEQHVRDTAPPRRRAQTIPAGDDAAFRQAKERRDGDGD